MNVLDLFSGIGGFSLGLERAGMKTVAFCEIDPYCRAVLRRHWPDVPVYDDVRTLTAARLAADGILAVADPDHQGQLQQGGPEREVGQRPRYRGADVVCGGFPCQDISVAGKGVGIDGERSGLWSEYARIIGEVRPSYVVVENVAALLGRGLGTVLGDLAEIGYDAEWHCIPACAVGALHRRDRVWIMACADGRELQSPGRIGVDGSGPQFSLASRIQREIGASGSHEHGYWLAADADCEQTPRIAEPRRERGQWLVEPAMGELVDGVSGGLVRFAGRVAKSVPDRVSKLRALGNAIVPQIATIIGHAITAHAHSLDSQRREESTRSSLARGAALGAQAAPD